MTKEALKLALEALETLMIERGSIYEKAITAIYEALAQPEHGWTPKRIAGMARLKEAQDKKLAQPEQEPVGEIVDAIEGAFKCSFTKMLPVGTKLYTTPPQRTWVGLMRGVRVEGDTVVISVKGGNDAARELCGALIEEMNR